MGNCGWFICFCSIKGYCCYFVCCWHCMLCIISINKKRLRIFANFVSIFFFVDLLLLFSRFSIFSYFGFWFFVLLNAFFLHFCLLFFFFWKKKKKKKKKKKS